MGVMDALAESRMTDKEIECFNQVAKEVEANRQRMKGRNRTTKSSTNHDGTPLASLNVLTSFARSNGLSDQLADEHDDMMIGAGSRKLPFQGAKLKIISSSGSLISPPPVTPDSGVSMGTQSDGGYEINVRLVSRPLLVKIGEC